MFSVTLEVIVSPNERPRTDSMYPWEKFDTQKLNPRILFSSKDELYQVLNDFGKISKLSHRDIKVHYNLLCMTNMFAEGK